MCLSEVTPALVLKPSIKDFQMYFYVDETGHTGPNLFDPTQPVLLYGILSSSDNLDKQAEKELAVLRKNAARAAPSCRRAGHTPAGRRD